MDEMVIFLLAVASIFILAAVITLTVAYIKKRKALKEIRYYWGKKSPREYRDTDMESISSYYRNSRDDYDGISIDDITWNDLDMDSVYRELNRTLTSTGEEYLYATLRRPETDIGSIEERNRLIEYFRAHPEDREKIQLELYRLGRRRRIDVTDFLYNKRDPAIGKRALYIFLASLSLFAIILIILGFQETGLPLLALMFIINMGINNNRKKFVQSGLDALGYMTSMIGCGLKICRSNAGGIEKYREALHAHCLKVKSAAKTAINILVKTDNPILEYINILFMLELISFENSFRKFLSRRDDVLEVFRIIGFIDSCLSIASYRESLGSWCVPELHAMDKGSAAINAEDIYHPLIENPVTNPVFISKPLLVTGSNASGKSTYLKTIAINAIFAQTIATCLAKKYRSAVFNIFSSMAIKDSVVHGESYYIAEIKSLKRIIERTEEDLPVLCVIDEVLRGTNTIERIAASSQVLRYLAEKRVLCIAATHDLELSDILGQIYDNCHFQEKYTGNNIEFDYTLYPGKSSTRNAIKLLGIMGFPAEVVKDAEKRAERFVEEGSWI